MHIALTPEQLRLREELREYFAALVTPEVRAGLSSATGEFDTLMRRERHRAHQLHLGPAPPVHHDDGGHVSPYAE